MEPYKRQVENLVFEGGGIKAFAFLGAVDYLEAEGMLQHCKRFAGSSAGAITACLLACGYGAAELKASLLAKNWNDFIPESKLTEGYQLIHDWGLHSGDPFVKWLSDLVEKKMGDAKITFQELFDKTGHELVVTASCLNRRMMRFLHKDKHPNFSIVTAVRMSMSIPFFFTPVEYEGCLYVDGGLLNNFPLWVFDCDEIPDWALPCDNKPSDKTVGFKLLSDAELDEHTHHLYPLQKIDSLKDYTFALVDAMLEQMDRLDFKPSDIMRTVFIPTHTVNATDFDISPANRDMLVTEGLEAARDFFSQDAPPAVNQLDNLASSITSAASGGSLLSSVASLFSHSRARAIERMRNSAPSLTTPVEPERSQIDSPPVVIDPPKDGEPPKEQETVATRRSYCEIM